MAKFLFFLRKKAESPEENSPSRRWWTVAFYLIGAVFLLCVVLLFVFKGGAGTEQPIDYIDMPYFLYDPIASSHRGLKFKLTVPADGVSMELSADGGHFVVYPLEYENNRRIKPLYDQVTSITLSYDCIVYWRCWDDLQTTHGQILLRKDGNIVGYSVLAFASAFEDVPEYGQRWTAPGPYMPQVLRSVAVPLTSKNQQHLPENYVAWQINRIKKQQHSVDTIESPEFQKTLRQYKDEINADWEKRGEDFRFPLD